MGEPEADPSGFNQIGGARRFLEAGEQVSKIAVTADPRVGDEA